jgi:RNA polymerase sigma factor (sigma-70 family)
MQQTGSPVTLLYDTVYAMTADTAAKALDWERLFQTHYRSLYRALVGATGRTDGVDDAIQDAFAQGLRGKLPHDVRSVEGWLFVVALNKIKRTQRRGMRFVPLRRQDQSGDAIDAANTRVDVLARLETLSQRERELLVAKFYVGLSQDEIAKSLGISRGTVSSAVSRAAARFRAGGTQ